MLNRDLKPGDFFTVVKWITPYRCTSYTGDVLEAVVIDYPFVRAFLHTSNAGLKPGKFTLNLGLVNIKRLSQEFVDDALSGVHSEDIEELDSTIKTLIEDSK